MSQQCVPSWDLQHPQQYHSFPHDVPSLEYEVAELTWENGQPSLHGLGLPRASNKHALSAAAWDNNPPHSSAATGETLESVVNQATTRRRKSSAGNELVPWYDHPRHQDPAAFGVPTAKSGHHARSFMDALVPRSRGSSHRNPNNSSNNKEQQQQQQHSTTHAPGISACMVGSCSGGRARVNVGSAESGGGRDQHRRRAEGSEYLGGGGGFTSEMSPEGTSSGGGEYTRTSGDDSCHSMSQRETGDEEIVIKKRSTGKTSVTTKQSRAAAIHNQSERRRRDKINQRMKILKKLVPNSSKTDKASILDEVLDYLKQLQAQLYLMSRTNTMTMLPPFMQQQQHLQMPPMNMRTMPMPPGLGLGMGLGLGSIVDFNAAMVRAAGSAGNAMQPNPSFMPSAAVGPWDNSNAFSAFLACQAMQPMNMDTYSRLAALYQQFQQPPPSGS